MVDRVTHFRIRPGKMEEFVTTAQSLTPAMDKLHGFRLLLILRGEDKDSRDAMSISIWDSAADVSNSENDDFYCKTIAKSISYCDSFSPMHVEEVLLSKFANL
jgi:heme-degrading monooxygenase HmoA